MKTFMESNFEKIIDASPMYIYWKEWKETEGVYLGCNQLVIDLANFQSKADIIGKNDTELWPNYAPMLIAHDKAVIQAGHVMTFEEKINGRTNLSIKTPWRDEEGNIIGIIGNSLDITHFKEMEVHLKETQEIAEAAKSLAKNKFSFFKPWKTQTTLQLVNR